MIELQTGYTVHVKQSEVDEFSGRAIVLSADASGARVDLDGQERRFENDRLIFIGCHIDDCTMYLQGGMGMGYNRVLCKRLRIGIGKYAQYTSAVHVSYLEKGKRKERGFVQSYKPNLIVALGTEGMPEPPSMFKDPVPAGDGVTVTRARHSSFSDGWKVDFEAAVLPLVKVLLDFNDHNSMQNLG